jgi:hypothetical protein
MIRPSDVWFLFNILGYLSRCHGIVSCVVSRFSSQCYFPVVCVLVMLDVSAVSRWFRLFLFSDRNTDSDSVFFQSHGDVTVFSVSVVFVVIRKCFDPQDSLFVFL